MQHQHGIGLLGMLFFLLLSIFLVTVGVKLGPHYMEYLTVRSAMQDLAAGPPSLGEGEKSALFQAIDDRLYVNNVDDVKIEDFKYERTRRGNFLKVSYEVREHLFGNVAAVMTFSHQVQVGKK